MRKIANTFMLFMFGFWESIHYGGISLIFMKNFRKEFFFADLALCVYVKEQCKNCNVCHDDKRNDNLVIFVTLFHSILRAVTESNKNPTWETFKQNSVFQEFLIDLYYCVKINRNQSFWKGARHPFSSSVCKIACH